jgi:ribosome recycling factor
MSSSSLVGQIEEKMKKTLELHKKELSTVRSGRASSALLDKIVVSAYGAEMPLKQLGGISAPEPRLLVVQPFDKSTIPAIEKAILKSDLGLVPSVDGAIIRIPIPQLTEERRKDLVKIVKKKVEEGKVVLRNLRREANEQLKEQEKKGEIPEDEVKRLQDQVQKLVDHYTKELDAVFSAKEKEIMEV